MPNLLLVANCPSDNTKAMMRAIEKGTSNKDISNVVLRAKQPLDADAEDVLWASGVIIGTTENFGYMSGQIKDFFERIYYPCLEKTEALPCALYIKGGLDGQGAKQSVERIITGLRWKLIQDPLILHGAYRAEFLEHCEQLGMQMAAGLEVGIY